MIADVYESGASKYLCLYIVNQYRESVGHDALTISPIRTCIRRCMKPKYIRARKKSQGSTDPNAPWSKARYNWYIQLLIRFGALSEDEMKELKDEHGGTLPDYFDPNKLTKLSITKIVWYDETHKKCVIGWDKNKFTSKACFPRDEHGKLDFVNCK
jgi:hypothetical protein